MPHRRRRKNHAGAIYLSLIAIAILASFVVYLGFVKNPTIERHTEKIVLELAI